MKRGVSLICLALLLLGGCATRQRFGEPIPVSEGRQVLAAFLAATRPAAPVPGLDAEVVLTLSFSGLLGDRSGTVAGYLLAREPALVKFVGLTPLGQPFLLFSTDGERFQTIVVTEGRAYAGRLGARKVQEYAPAVVEGLPLYFWLFGGIGRAQGVAVQGRDRDGEGYWLSFAADRGSGRNLALFDPATGLVRKRFIEDEDGGTLLEVEYDNYQTVPGVRSPLPARVAVSGLPRNGRLVLEFRDLAAAEDLGAADFTLRLPPGFQRIEVE